ncbi:MAG: SDR family NAD(P)-dependent oxidoreductase, partial [Polyangiaceae bacterium]|nr:SDR family NAD(P)-dependent oxidoreductase [Polyangiaceae bacterium]
VREAYGIEREAALKLKDFPTLAHVIRWVKDKRPDLAGAPAAPAPAAGVEPTPARTPAPAAAPSAAPADDPVRAKVIDIVSQQTGYPPEMLDVDLDLEADLGVDTVKQAETFAAVREAYGIEREASLKLKDFPTLAHVIGWVKDKRPDLAGPPAAPAPAVGVERAPAATPAVPVPVATPAPADDPVRAKVVEIVAQQTGYPPEMLDVELDLEADLGVDTVKQAETFAAVREAYGIEREASLKLKDFPTLAHVIGWVKERRPDLAGAPPPPAASGPVDALALPRGDAEAAARVLRRVPVPVLRPPLERTKATGVRLAAGDRVLVMLDQGGVGVALARELRDRGVEVAELHGAAEPARFVAEVERLRGAAPFTGVYWLPGLDDEGDPHALGPDGWRAALGLRAKLLYHAARTLYADLGAGRFVLTATRLGGRHGAGEDGATAPLGGAVTGLAKALARERPDALVKAVDFELDAPPDAVAHALVAETLRDPGAVEIGHRQGARHTLTLVEEPLATGRPLALGPDAVVGVAGAAGRIVSAIVADLATAGGHYYLLDLAPEARRDDPDVARFAADREAMKRELVARAQARGERPTPVAIDKALAALERAAAGAAARAAIERAGGTAYYRQVDLRAAAAVAGVIDEVRARHGRIDVLLHAAGLEVSRFLPDKKPEEFELVFDVKSQGWCNLLTAIGTLPLGATVGFSSIAGRFGNGGQSDYAAANDLLAKLAGHARRARPDTNALVIDWTAWGGIGMASRGSIPKMMEAAGIDMLPAAAGIPIVGRELRAGSRGEVLIAGRLGALEAERDAEGGLEVAAVDVAAAGPMVERVLGMPLSRGLCVEASLDPGAQPFLRDHRIDGTAVLPGVMGLEAFAEVARLGAPGAELVALEDVAFLAPFKLYRDEPRTASVEALFTTRGSEVLARCRLTGSRTLAGQPEPSVTTHFTATARLGGPALAVPAPLRFATGGARAVRAEAIYRLYFHGPAYQVLDACWLDGPTVVGRLRADLPPNHVPATRPTALDPRLLELCFQTAGVWEIGTTGRMGLPARIERVLRYRAGADAVGLHALVTPRADGAYDALVVDAAGAPVAALVGYRTVALGEVDAALRSPIAAAMSRAPD